MDLEKYIIQIVTPMKVNGRITKNQEMGLTFGKMVKNMLENGKMT